MSKSDKTPRAGRSRLLRVCAYGAIAACLLAVATVVVLRLRFNGPDLADTIEDILNDRIRGRVEIDTVEWPVTALPKVVTGGWIPVTVRGLRVYDDSQPRKLILSTPLATGAIDAHSLMFGNHDFVFQDIELPDGGYALIEEVPEPYPIHAYDRTVVSLVSAFYARQRPAFRAGLGAYRAPIFDLRDYTIRGATLEFVFPGFTARTEDVTGSGFLYADASDPLSPKLYYSLTPRAARGTLTIAERTVELTDIEVSQLEQLPTGWPRDPVAHNVEWAATAHTPEGARVSLAGGMYDYWENWFGGDYNIVLSIDRAGGLAARLSEGLASGEALALRVDVTGPMLRPKYGLHLTGLALAVPVRANGPPLDLLLDRATLAFDEATETGYLEDTVARGAGGEVQLSASFGLSPYTFDLHAAITEPIEFAPYVPREVETLVGTQLSGRLHAFGNTKIQQVDTLDLRLGRAHLTGELVRDEGASVHAKRLRVQIGDTVITSRGVIDVVSQTVDLALGIASRDVARWLRGFRVPAWARTVDGTGYVRGPFLDPRAGASLSIGGVPVVDRAQASISYADGALDIARLSSRTLDGELDVQGRITLDGKISRLDGTVRGVNLSKVPGLGGIATGRLDADLSARGSFDRLDASLEARAQELSIAGDAYANVSAQLQSSADGSRALHLHADREQGGNLDAQVLLGADDAIGGAVSVRGFPLQSLSALREPGADSPVGGTVDAELQLGGTPEAPLAEGTIQVVRSWIGQAFLGNLDVRIDQAGPDRVRLAGSLLQGRLRVMGTVSTRLPYDADLRLSFRRVEIDQFVPELARRAGARGWVSGEVALRAPLLPGAGMPTADITLTEAVVVVDHTDARGRPAPLRVRSVNPITARFDGASMEVLGEALFDGQVGSFKLTGRASAESLDLRLAGVVDVRSLGPYLSEYFADPRGEVTFDIAALGPLTAPTLDATLDISREVAVQPLGQDAVVSIPEGRIQLANDQIAVTGLDVNVVDRFTDERARLTVAGGVKLADFRPALWALQIDGELAGKMLLVAAPQELSAAGGMANLSLAILGVGDSPDISGTLDFQTARPLTFTPRGLRREITLSAGALSFTETRVQFDNVRGLLDDEGRFVIGAGNDCETLNPKRCSEISLEEWQPVDVDVTLSADALPFRIPQTLDLTLNIAWLRIVGGTGPGSSLDIAGLVEVVDGRYVRKFNLGEALRPERSVETSRPFYEEIPQLANANLDLTLDVRAFFVQNNIADIEMAGNVEVAGSPVAPRLSGDVQVERGEFKLQGMRAKFTRTQGSVVFSEYKRFPTETPVLDIMSEADYRDPSGQEHLITLTIDGPLNALQWDLFTSSGLNKGQAITLLVSGRTPEEFRKTLGDEAPGRDPSRIDPSTNPNDNVADQLLKDLAGDFLSLLLEDTLRNLTSFDVARLEIGTGSIGFHGEKEIIKNLRLLGDLEQTLRGRTVDMRGQVRLSDDVSVESSWLDKNFADESEEDISDVRLRLVYRFLWF